MRITDIYPFMLIAGAAVYCIGQKPRKLLWLKAALVAVLFLGYYRVLQPFILALSFGEVFRTYSYLIDWALLFFGILFLFDIRITTVAFCTTCGYCLQHITQRVYYLLSNYVFNLHGSQTLRLLLYVFIGVVVMALAAILYRKESKNIAEEPLVYDVLQLSVTTFSLFISLGVESVAGNALFASGSETLIIGNFLISILFALLIVILEYNIVFRRRAASENTVLKQMIIKEREQYQIEQNVIEAINIKVHDMKNRLTTNKGLMDFEEAEEIRESISMYDSIYKTGNKALDIVLTMKGLECKSKGIEFTCMAEVEKLSFMRESEVYSLFVNLLNNCIEAVEHLPQEQRVISLSIASHGAGLCITSENYFEGDRTMENGLPPTTKKDKLYHGYGLKSIKQIVQKYQGELRLKAENGVFVVSILFL